MTAKHLVIVPHTHWDREWYMPFERFRKRLVSMMDRLLDILETDKEYKYFELDGQTIVLFDYLAIRPENDARLRSLIEEGRIIIGPWYVLPDEFLVSGESLIRNLRVGIKVARQFGRVSLVGYIPDMFGHIGQMPQIFAGLGIESAVAWRGIGDTVKDTQFLWEAPDGTQLFTVYLANSYSHANRLPSDPALLRDRLCELIENQKDFCNVESMLLMNGDDHIEPQQGLPALLEQAMNGMDGVTFEMGNLAIFIDQVRGQADSLSVHRGEFRSAKRAPLIPGVTSARVQQKQRDFLNCSLLEKYVEPLSVWAHLCGDTRPYANFLDYAWRLTLENHPHDSICGCSVDPVHDEMETRFERVQQLGRTLQYDALSFLANHTDSSWADENAPVLCVYNPTAAASGIVDVTVPLEEPDFVKSIKDGKGRSLSLLKSVGEREVFIELPETPETIREYISGMEGRELLGYYINNILWQREGNVLRLSLIMGYEMRGEFDGEEQKKQLFEALSDPSIEQVHVRGISGARTKLTFLADDLAPAGLSTFSLSDREAAGEAGGVLETLSDCLENDFYRISMNQDGTLDILDKDTGCRFPRCLGFIDEGDRGDSYTYDAVPGGEVVESMGKAADVSIIESGPVRAVLKVTVSLDVPEKLTPERNARSSNRMATEITTLVTLYRDFKRIDFQTTLDNQCEDHRIRVLFNAPFVAPCINTETTFGMVERPSRVVPDESEYEAPIGTGPQKTFSAVENGSAGMALFNRGIPEIEAVAGDDDTILALTLIRSFGWLAREDLHTRPNLAGPKLQTPGGQSKGPHSFEYAFFSYAGTYADSGVIEQAHAFAFPPTATVTDSHEGVLRDRSSLAAIDNPSVRLSAVEQSGKGRGYLVRVYNSTNRPQTARVTLWGDIAEVHDVNLLEERVADEPLIVEDGKIGVDLRPAEIRTFQVLLK